MASQTPVGRPWVRFPSGTQNFSLSHARVIVEKDHLHYSSPSLKKKNLPSLLFNVNDVYSGHALSFEIASLQACH